MLHTALYMNILQMLIIYKHQFIYIHMGVGLQEKLEARELLEIDSFFGSTRDRLEKKQAEFEHFM